MHFNFDLFLPSSFRWTKNGELLDWKSKNITQHPTKGTLIFTQPKESDQGYYQCVLENDQGKAVSNIVNVRKISFNGIKRRNGIIETMVREGQSFKLSCQPNCNLPKELSLIWKIKQNDRFKLIDDPRIVHDPEGNLYFSNILLGDAATYVAWVKPRKLRRIEREVQRVVLTVTTDDSVKANQAPREKYRTPQNTTGQVGEEIVLSCIFAGTPMPTVLWKQNDGVIEPNDRINVNGAQIVIINATLDDAGLYTCIVSNDATIHNPKVYSIFLNIVSVPRFTIEPHNEVVRTDQRVKFICSADGNPKPAIQWTKNGLPFERVANSELNKITIDNDSLIIRDVEYSDTTNFGCNASNAIGYVYKDFYLKVINLAPRILWKLENKKVFVGDSAKLYCGFYGVPAPDLRWSADSHDIYNQSRYEIDPNGYLTIYNVTLEDEGQFKCVASNLFGTAIESANLIVWQHTHILGDTVRYHINEGEEITIDCQVVSDSRLHVEINWYKNYSELESSRFVRHSNNSLTILDAKRDDAGTYQCSASTSRDEVNADQGIVEINFQNETLGRPLKNPENIKITSSKPGNLIITWKPITESEQNGANFRYLVQWRESHLENDWQTKSIHNARQSTEIIESLPSYTLYTVRVLSENDHGLATQAPQIVVQGYSGEDMILTAPRELTLLQIIDSQSVLIRWKAPLLANDYRGEIVGYKILVWNDGNLDNVKQNEVVKSASTSIVNGLKPGVNNYISILAYSQMHDGPASESIKIVMPTL